MIYDVFYYDPDGQLMHGFDPRVARKFLDQFIGKIHGRMFVIATNIDGDRHRVCIDPKGNVVSYNDLPWVVAAANAENRTQQRIEADVVRQGLRRMRQIGVSVDDVRENFVGLNIRGNVRWVALLEIEGAAAQEDTGDGRVPFYKAILDSVVEHQRKHRRNDAVDD